MFFIKFLLMDLHKGLGRQDDRGTLTPGYPAHLSYNLKGGQVCSFTDALKRKLLTFKIVIQFLNIQFIKMPSAFGKTLIGLRLRRKVQ